jgi:hypothetical protein
MGARTVIAEMIYRHTSMFNDGLNVTVSKEIPDWGEGWGKSEALNSPELGKLLQS